MFSFFKRKPPPEAAPPAEAVPAPTVPAQAGPTAAPEAEVPASTASKPLATIARWFGAAPPAPMPPAAPPVAPPPVAPLPPALGPAPAPAVAAVALPAVEPVPEEAPEERRRWFDRLKGGLRKTGSAITQVFTGTKIDEALYEELETALLMADAGVKATDHLLADLRRRVKDAKATEPSAVKGLLADAITELLMPLERGLVVGRHTPTVIMVVGVNGAGKTTSIGKLTRYLADHRQKVLLAAADTFRAAAREQLAVWAERSDAGRGAVPDAAPVACCRGWKNGTRRVSISPRPPSPTASSAGCPALPRQASAPCPFQTPALMRRSAWTSSITRRWMNLPRCVKWHAS